MSKKKYVYRSYRIEPLLKFGKNGTKYSNFNQKLSSELMDIYEKLKLSEIEWEIRNKVFESFKKVICEELSYHRTNNTSVNSGGSSRSGDECFQVLPFGSFSTKLMINESDIDISIICNSSLSKNEINDLLHEVMNIINKHALARGQIIHIKNARCPILKVCERVYGIKVNVSINQRGGIETADYLKNLLMEYKGMDIFLILLKYFLKRRRQSDALTGGLVGYAQFLLVYNFIQLHPLFQQVVANAGSGKNQNGSRDDGDFIKNNLGVLFIDFFQYYSKFPFNTAIVDVLKKKYSINDTGRIFVLDPVAFMSNPSVVNNVTKNCTNIKMIQNLFRYTYMIMTSAARQDQIDYRKNVVDLWYKIDNKEMNGRTENIEKYLKE